MEKPNEYRNELADKLREIRNSDEENPEKARAKAEGYLEAKKETHDYQIADEIHQRDRFIDKEHKENVEQRFERVVDSIAVRQAQIRNGLKGVNYTGFEDKINVQIGPIREAFDFIKKREGELADYNFKIEIEYDVDYEKEPITTSETKYEHFRCIGRIATGSKTVVKPTPMGRVTFSLLNDKGQSYKIFEKELSITEGGGGYFGEEDKKVIKSAIDEVVAKHTEDYKKA